MERGAIAGDLAEVGRHGDAAEDVAADDQRRLSIFQREMQQHRREQAKHRKTDRDHQVEDHGRQAGPHEHHQGAEVPHHRQHRGESR